MSDTARVHGTAREATGCLAIGSSGSNRMSLLTGRPRAATGNWAGAGRMPQPADMKMGILYLFTAVNPDSARLASLTFP